MKRYIVYAIVCGFAMSLTSCFPQKRTGSEGDDEVEAEYYDEAYEVTEDNIIDPNDEEAYRKYGSGDEAEEVQPAEVKSEEAAPSSSRTDVDILDQAITTTRQIDLILDDMENLNKTLRQLYKDRASNAAAIQKGMDRAIRITEKINEGAENMTPKQLERYEQLTNEFLEVIKG